MRAFLLCLVLGMAMTTARAQQPTPPTTILFVGNSFTYGGSTKVHAYNAASVTDEPPGEPGVGGIPAIFKQFADETGMRYEVHVETVGGKTLEFHYQNARGLFALGKWDAVVLQGLSTEPLPAARGGKPENFLHSATLLENTAHQARAATKIYLYETWAYPFDKYTWRKDNWWVAAREMSRDLQAGYEAAFSTDAHFEAVAPVGDAFLSVMLGETIPNEKFTVDIDLLGNDSKHPSMQGAYLSALVLFQTITGYDVTKLGGGEQVARDLELSPKLAVALQEAADLTVRSVHYTSQGVRADKTQRPSAVHP